MATKQEIKASQSFLKNTTSPDWDYVSVTNQSARIATLPKTAVKLRVVYQQDNRGYYAVNASEDASVLANWLPLRNETQIVDLTPINTSISQLNTDVGAVNTSVGSVSTRVSAIENKKVRSWVAKAPVKETWYTNTTPQEMEINASSTQSANYAFLQIEMRKDSTSPSITINSNILNGTTPYEATVTATIPSTWQYRWKDSGGAGRSLKTWLEYRE